MNTRYPHIPLANREPECRRIVDALLGDAPFRGRHWVEYIVDDVSLRPVLETCWGDLDPWGPRAKR